MTHQTNEELIKAFKNHLDYYKDLKDKWEFLKTPEDRAFHAGKTQGMLLGLEVIERISIPQPEQLEVEFMDGCFFKREGTFEQTSRAYTYAIGILNRKDDGYGILFWCDTKQEALDFCKRFNLKVVNEEKE